MARASKVQEQDWALGVCPVCKKEIVGTITVALQFGPMKVDVRRVGDEVKPSARVGVSASLRSLVVAHRCAPDTAPIPAPDPDSPEA